MTFWKGQNYCDSKMASRHSGARGMGEWGGIGMNRPSTRDLGDSDTLLYDTVMVAT